MSSTHWNFLFHFFAGAIFLFSFSLLSQYWHLSIVFFIHFEIFLVLGIISNGWLKSGHFCIVMRLWISLKFCFSWLSLTALWQGQEALPCYCQVEVEVHVSHETLHWYPKRGGLFVTSARWWEFQSLYSLHWYHTGGGLITAEPCGSPNSSTGSSDTNPMRREKNTLLLLDKCGSPIFL